MEERLPDGNQVFRASWRSPQAMVIVSSLMGVLIGLVLASLRVPVGLPLWVLVLLIAGLCWWFARPILNKVGAIEVGSSGVSGHGFRGQTIRWSDVENIVQQPYQGQNLPVLVLCDGSPFIKSTRSIYSSGRKRHLPFALLAKPERELAADAVLQAFHQHGGEQAKAAVRIVRDETLAHTAFEQRLREKTPSLWALYAVVALNVGVWLLNLLDGLSPMQPETADLFRWGGSSASAVVRDGEYWRLVTATVLHGGLLHLALNMYALWVAGTQVCRWFGNGQFLLIYWASALGGAALSLHFSAQQAVSVGASGAVFGVLGALLAGVWQHRSRVPKALVTQLFASQGLFVFASLAQGFARPGIDNAAHVGGLLTGAAMAWLLVEVVDEQANNAQRRSRQWMATAMAAVAVAALVGTTPAGVDHRALFAEQNALRHWLPAYQAAERALRADTLAQREGRLSPEQLLTAMEQRHIPAYRRLGEDLIRASAGARSQRIDDLRGLQSGVLELMTLEVGQGRGRLDAAQASARGVQVSAELAQITQRLKADSGQ